MKKVFTDANVLLDVWLKRTAGFADAQKILIESERKKITAYTSPSLILTAMYFLKKEGLPSSIIISLIDNLLRIVTLVSPSEQAFRNGLYAGFTDLEDAVQYHTALQISNLDYLITSNTKDFKKASGLLPVITPKDFFNL